jgi:hypothetical protein
LPELYDLTVTSDKFIKFFIDNFPIDTNACEFGGYTKNLCKKIFKQIKKYNTFLKLNKSKLLKTHLIKIESKKQIPTCELNTSRFISDKIKSHINKHSKYHLQYVFTYLKQVFKINFILFNAKDINNLHVYDNYIHNVLIWLLFATDQSINKKCSEHLTVFIYMIDIKKEFPNMQTHVIDHTHVNSALTRTCDTENNIVIFRKEEWFKVLIHETFHSFSLDFSGYLGLNVLNAKLKTIFNIDSEFNAYESYSEFWAELLNVLFISFIFNKNKESFNEYWQSVSVILFYEIQFSLMQCVKVLNFMKLNYTDLFTNRGKKLYKEKTNVFSYHILKTILLFNIDDFLAWCKQYNLSILQFNNKKFALDGFFTFIKTNYLKPQFINKLLITENYLKTIRDSSRDSPGDRGTISRELLNTFRMSIVDMC